ncbi:protease inhibitor I42 family protein [Chloroflexota bacterium]
MFLMMTLWRADTSVKKLRLILEIRFVTLSSNPTTGFQWAESAQISALGVLQQTDHQLVMLESEPPPPPGTAGQEIWTFKALKRGTPHLWIIAGLGKVARRRPGHLF